MPTTKSTGRGCLLSSTAPRRSDVGAGLPIVGEMAGIRSLRKAPVHRWYTLNMSYSDELVRRVLNVATKSKTRTVLDPFCGSGTTLIEAKLRRKTALGIDANPACVFFSKIKTDWSWRPQTLGALALTVAEEFVGQWDQQLYLSDPRFDYTIDQGLVSRGWISRHKLARVITVLRTIEDLDCAARYKRLLLGAAIASVRERVADVGFGPELYCLGYHRGTHVIPAFLSKVRQMVDDRVSLDTVRAGASVVMDGDARDCDELVTTIAPHGVDLILTSPPYPNEHEYSRNTRIELILLGLITNRSDLRRLKQRLLRSSTKGIYEADDDASFVRHDLEIASVARLLERRAKSRRDGFSRLYGAVVREYFGGMRRHLRSARKCLRRNGLAYYVLSDQQCYLGVHIDTPRIVAKIAKREGFRLLGKVTTGCRRGTTGSRYLREQLVMLRRE